MTTPSCFSYWDGYCGDCAYCCLTAAEVAEYEADQAEEAEAVARYEADHPECWGCGVEIDIHQLGLCVRCEREAAESKRIEAAQ
jgi:hypothetical protein